MQLKQVSCGVCRTKTNLEASGYKAENLARNQSMILKDGTKLNLTRYKNRIRAHKFVHFKSS